MVNSTESKEIKAEAIIKLINKYFNLDCRDLDKLGSKVVARQFAMYYIRTFLKMGLSETGMLFPSKESASGFKGHVTVRHAIRTIQDLIEVDSETRDYDRDLYKEVELIAALDIKEIKKYKIRSDISKQLKKLTEGQLVRVNLYLDHYFLNGRP